MKPVPYVLIGLLFFQYSCSSNKYRNTSKEPRFYGLLRYYIQADKPNFTIHTTHFTKEIESVKLNRPNDFRVVSVTPTQNGTNIEISRLTKTLFHSLSISFIDSTNTTREIHLRFYSKVFKLNEIKSGETIVFNRRVDVAPPLFVVSSLQVGAFIICKNDSIIEQFDMLQELYYYCLKEVDGNYGIGENNCENIYFNLELQSKP